VCVCGRWCHSHSVAASAFMYAWQAWLSAGRMQAVLQQQDNCAAASASAGFSAQACVHALQQGFCATAVGTASSIVVQRLLMSTCSCRQQIYNEASCCSRQQYCNRLRSWIRRIVWPPFACMQHCVLFTEVRWTCQCLSGALRRCLSHAWLFVGVSSCSGTGCLGHG
jgi:hypothetical protein